MTDGDSRKIADATLNKVKQFTVGFAVEREKNRPRREAAFWSSRAN
jgi:hypothetical protein